MLLITEVKDCHNGNVEELSRKLEALTQEIQTLKQKAETSAGDKPKPEASKADKAKAAFLYEYGKLRDWLVSRDFHEFAVPHEKGDELIATIFVGLCFLNPSYIDKESLKDVLSNYAQSVDRSEVYTPENLKLFNALVARVAPDKPIVKGVLEYFGKYESLVDAWRWSSITQTKAEELFQIFYNWADCDRFGASMFLLQNFNFSNWIPIEETH